MTKILMFLLIVVGLQPLGHAVGGAPSAHPPVSTDLVTKKCNAEYCVKVVLSRILGERGELKVYQKDAAGTYNPTDIACKAIGGNPKAYPKDSYYTPAGVRSIYKRDRVLQYNGAPDNGFEYASYFYRTGGRNNIAIHTAPSYSQNSHGCIRASCAVQIYSIQGDVEVQVDYKN